MDFETGLINALGELNKERMEKKYLKEELTRLKESYGEDRKVVINLKARIDKANVIEENIKDQLKEKHCLEAEIVSKIKET
jgi:DNA gyrase/topoisomerase IV subunit A